MSGLTVIEGFSNKIKKEFDADSTKKVIEKLEVQFETGIVNGEFLINAMSKDDMTKAWSFGMEQDYIMTNFNMMIEEEVDGEYFVYTLAISDKATLKFCEHREYTYFCEKPLAKYIWNCLVRMGFGVEEIHA